jgi:hypothetical protein
MGIIQEMQGDHEGILTLSKSIVNLVAPEAEIEISSTDLVLLRGKCDGFQRGQNGEWRCGRSDTIVMHSAMGSTWTYLMSLQCLLDGPHTLSPFFH